MCSICKVHCDTWRAEDAGRAFANGATTWTTYRCQGGATCPQLRRRTTRLSTQPNGGGQTRRPSGVCGGRDSGVSRVLSPKFGPRSGPGGTTTGHKPRVRLVRRADCTPRTGGPEIGIVSAVPLTPDDEPSISPLMSSSSQRHRSPSGRCLAVGRHRRAMARRAGRSTGSSRILASPCGGNDAHTAGSSRDHRYGHSVWRVRPAVRRGSTVSVILNGREVPGGLIEPPPPR